MRLIVDANVIFSFFKRDSFTRGFIFTHPELELFVPEYLFDEIDEYRDIIIKKARIDDNVYDTTVRELRSMCNTVSLDDYSMMMEKAKLLSPDPDDIDYFALALYLNGPIWSNDLHLQIQKEILILTTEDIRKLYPY
jgi:predicted nucleic acid-binding protein